MRRILGLFALLSIAAACSASAGVGSDDPADTADPRSEDIRRLPGTYSDKLVDNIVASDVGVPNGIGVPDERVPFPDTYWPFNAGEYGNDGIAFRWQGQDVLSPAEKYAKLVTNGDQATIAKTVKWEHDHHGTGLPRQVADWEGHCPGWTGASMLNAPIKHPVFVKPDAQNGFAECTAGSDPSCIEFDIGDIDGLLAEVNVDGKQPLIGAGCFTSDPSVDEFDRIKRNPNRVHGENGVGCKGLNPGALMMVLGGRLKRDHQAFAINAQQQGITDQIWNQPVYRYEVNSYEEIDTAKAIGLVATNSQGTAAPASYIWNARAKGFALVDITMWWTSERGPNRSFVSGLQSTRKHRIKAVIELDTDIVANPAARNNARIVGGEYLSDPEAAAQNPQGTFGPDRLAVPTFVWVAVDAGPENLTEAQANTTGFEHHNPFIKPSIVKKLAALGAR